MRTPFYAARCALGLTVGARSCAKSAELAAAADRAGRESTWQHVGALAVPLLGVRATSSLSGSRDARLPDPARSAALSDVAQSWQTVLLSIGRYHNIHDRRRSTCDGRGAGNGGLQTTFTTKSRAATSVIGRIGQVTKFVRGLATRRHGSAAVTTSVRIAHRAGKRHARIATSAATPRRLARIAPTIAAITTAIAPSARAKTAPSNGRSAVRQRPRRRRRVLPRRPRATRRLHALGGEQPGRRGRRRQVPR